MTTTAVRSKLSPWTLRLKTQLVSLVLLNSWIWGPAGRYVCVPVLNCYACSLATTACPIGSISAFALVSQIPYYIIGTLGLVGATMGRFFCGWVCPFGFLQDLLFRIRTRKFRLFRGANALKYLLLFGLVIAAPRFLEEPPPPPIPAWAMGQPGAPPAASQTPTPTGSDRVVKQTSPSYDYCALICPAGTLEAGVPALVINRAVREKMTPKSWMKLGILAFVLVLMVFSRRSFCRMLCPLGAAMALCSRASLLRLETDRSRCTRCHKCVSACPTRARQVPEPTRRKEATAECLNCLDCVKVCPEPGALRARLGNRSIMVSRGRRPAPVAEETIGAP